MPWKNTILAAAAAVALTGLAQTAQAGQLLDGWPDAIKCDVTNPASGELVFYLAYIDDANSKTGYRFSQPNNFYDVQFNQDQTFSGYFGGVIVASDCNKSISQLYTDGQAIDFSGISTGAVVLFNDTNCPSGWTRQLQVEGSNNDFAGVTCSKD
jgi:hypothetical protein